MSHYAIQSLDCGKPFMVMYVTEADSPEAALKAFDADVGIDPHGHGISADDWEITEISAEQAAQMDGESDQRTLFAILDGRDPD